MSFTNKPTGSSLIISLGIMSLLLILSGAVITTIFRSAHLTSNIANSNKAYFAAEGGLEEALYELTNHLAGFEAEVQTDLTNKSKFEYEISYREDGPDSNVPTAGKGNSPTNSDWNKLEYKDSYNINLFYDESTLGNQTEYDCVSGGCPDIINSEATSLNLYVRTADLDNDGDGDYVLPANKIYITWGISGTSESITNLKYTLLPIDDETNGNYSEITGGKINLSSSNPVLDFNTFGEDLEENEVRIESFLNTADLHMPRLKISATEELIDNIGNPIPYLEFRIEANDVIIPDSFATITSEGYAAITKQTIQTKIKQDGALSLFDYAIFQ